MARIEFRTKARDVFNHDDTLAYRLVQVPELTRKHCDMPAFRSHKLYGDLANSDLFPNILRRIRRDTFGQYGQMRLDRIPDGVTVEDEGFMCKVTIEV